tara:strand:- start:6732 stop:7184 length:453 start_codon:yes stop_codon:yes gene_type:complete
MTQIKLIAPILLLLPFVVKADNHSIYYECSSSYVAHHLAATNSFDNIDTLKAKYIYVFSATHHKLAQIRPKSSPHWLGMSERKYQDMEWHRLDLESEGPGSEFTFYEKTMRFSISETTGFLTGDPNISARISFGSCHKVTQKHFDLLFSR